MRNFPVPTAAEIDAVMAFEMLMIPDGKTVISYELEMMKEELLDFLNLVTTFTSENLNGIEGWCRNPQNSNYPDIAGMDFSQHPTALYCLDLIGILRM